MKQQRIIILLLFLLTCMLSCSPGHLGSNEIAFIRDGQLWTIDPDGANARAIVSDNTPVIGYGWSPTHQILVYRTLDAGFASTSAGKHLVTHAITGLLGDLPSTINTISIDGGTPIPIIFSSPDVQYSNAWWNTTGSRLLYREEPTSTSYGSNSALWWISQNDQPGGIARKLLPSSFSIPSIAANNMTIGNSQQGVFTTSLTGTNLQYLVNVKLPGHPLPATLERVLWQPAHDHPGILYAISTSPQDSSSTTPLTVLLVLRSMDGQVTTLATCACTQFAWSPDGNSILYSIGATYTILNINDKSSFPISGEAGSVPYWSPDSQFLLFDGQHTLTLLQVASKQPQVLLNDTTVLPGTDGVSTITRGAEVNALLQPMSNSIWATDSRHFLFLTKSRLLWQGKSLSSAKGLYTVSINDTGQVQGTPVLVDTGNDTQAGWTYEDANTSFLF